MPALRISASESNLPSQLIPPPTGAPLSAWAAYRSAAKAAGCYRATKQEIPVSIRARLHKAASVEKKIIREHSDLPKGLVPGRPPIRRIVAACAQEFGVDVSVLLSRRRKYKIVLARQATMYLAKKLTPRSLSEIGRLFDRDHTTVLHACRKIDWMVGDDPVFAARIAGVAALIMSQGAEAVGA